MAGKAASHRAPSGMSGTVVPEESVRKKNEIALKDLRQRRKARDRQSFGVL